MHRYLGDRVFFRRTLATALPIILQNLITNFVSLLDNIMVGQLHTAQISAVTIVNNNLLFIFYLCLFGCISCGGIFTTQFYGCDNQEGIRYTARFKLICAMILIVVGSGVFYFGSDLLVGLYLKGEGDAALAADTLFYGRQYLHIMILGIIPFSITNAYAGTLRECGHPTVPMVAGFIATFVNLVFNYLLIFGHLGLPAMGVAGAAVATVISRYVELAIVVIWTHRNPEKNPYIQGLFHSFRIPLPLLRSILSKGFPLIANETLFSAGLAILNQCYSVCGLDVVPALSISSTICNLTAVVYRSLGSTVGIITGQMLGAGHTREEMFDSNRKLTTLCLIAGSLFAIVTGALAWTFPLVFNTTDTVRQLAAVMILITAVAMPLQAYIHPVYFTLRAGGKTLITFLFDCGSIWLLSIPLAFVLTRFTSLSIIPIFALCNAMDIIKCVIGKFMIRKGTWIQNLTVQ